MTLDFPDDPVLKARSVEHLKWAASHDCAEALQVLSSLYNFGEGVPLDRAESRRLVLKAARLGRHECWQDLIFNCLGDGKSTQQVQEAMVYAMLASDAGYPQYLSKLEDELRVRGLSPNNKLQRTRGGSVGEG